MTGLGPQQVTKPLGPGSAQRRDPLPTRKKGSSESECPPPRLGDRREHEEGTGLGQAARGPSTGLRREDVKSDREKTSRVWRQDSLSLVLRLIPSPRSPHTLSGPLLTPV